MRQPSDQPLLASTPISLVLFDLDDTLCDYAGARTNRLRIAFRHGFGDAAHSSELLDAMVRESIRIHPHGTEHFGALLQRFGAGDESGAERARVWYQENRFHSLQLFAEALDIIELARGQHPTRTVGLVTNGPAEVQRGKIELLEIGDEFDFMLISGEFGSAKPEPAIFQEALRLGAATPRETLFIGDSLDFDIAGAAGCGIRSIWVNRTGVTRVAESPAPDFEVRDLLQLRGVLEHLVTRHP